jgi:hypothetical protein
MRRAVLPGGAPSDSPTDSAYRPERAGGWGGGLSVAASRITTDRGGGTSSVYGTRPRMMDAGEGDCGAYGALPFVD